MNLLTETVEDIARSGHTTQDVSWVGSANGEYAMPWVDFEPVAAGVNYDSGYGGSEIPGDLVVVFTDGSWLARGEYDGSEWWDFHRCPVMAAGKRFVFTDTARDMRMGGWVAHDFSFAAVS